MSADQDRQTVSTTEAAERLASRQPDILAAWLQALRADTPEARQVPATALTDSLPVLLEELRQALLEGRFPLRSQELPPAKSQARERAKHAGYSLDQVLREYQILREVVVVHVAGDRLLEPRARAILDAVFDAAMRQAALEFVAETQGALRRLSYDYELMVESTRDFAVFTLDLDGTILSWNPGAEQIFRLPASGAVGQHTDIIFTPEDREARASLQEMEAARRTGRAEDERWHVRADGTRFFASGVLVPLRNGELHGYAKVLRDVTERKLAQDERDRLLVMERRARGSAERAALQLRRLQAVTDVALTSLSEEDLLQDMLRRVQEALRADTAGILLREGDELVLRGARGLDPDRYPTVRVPMGRGFAGQIAATRRPLCVEDTASFPMYLPVPEWGIVSLLGVPLCVSGEVTGVLLVGTFTHCRFNEEDIHLLQLVGNRAAMAIERARLVEETSRRAAQLETIASAAHRLLAEERPEEFLRSIFDELSRTLEMEVYLNYMVDPDRKSLRLASSGGLPEEVARQIGSIAFGEALCGQVAQTATVHAIDDVQQTTSPQTELIRSLGITAYVCHPLIAGEELLGTLSFGTRKRQHFDPEELALLRTLCDQVSIALQRARLIEELHQRAEELEEADRRKDEFLATLAHELRNPLAGIANATYVLENSTAAEEQRSRLDRVIRRQTEHLSRMVDDLLDLSRITHGKIELRKEPVRAVAVARQAVEAVRPLVAARGHAFEVDLPDQPLWVCADPTRLEQILVNLLNNAAKYTDPGGRITMSVRPDRGHVVLEVRDTGIGMSPQLLSRIFDLFAQSERALDRSEGGLGIGLSLVKRLVELHGGTIHAYSGGKYRGSTFTVRLPELDPALQPELPQDASPEASHARDDVRVMVVEDNPDAAETLRDILELWGLQVRVEASGLAALGAFPEYQPELMLMDIGLPEMDGYALARELRSRYDLTGITLVALTGYGQEEDRQRSREAGFHHHLVKPLDPEALKPIVARVQAQEVAGS